MLLTDRNARTTLSARLQPGETLLHHAYGISQPNRVVIVLMYVFCCLIPAALLIRFRLTKHFLVGLTDQRLLVLRFEDLEKPDEAWDYNRAAIKAEGKQGWLWTYLKVADAQRPLDIKCHRAAMPHNREQSRSILEALTGQPVGG